MSGEFDDMVSDDGLLRMPRRVGWMEPKASFRDGVRISSDTGESSSRVVMTKDDLEARLDAVGDDPEAQGDLLREFLSDLLEEDDSTGPEVQTGGDTDSEDKEGDGAAEEQVEAVEVRGETWSSENRFSYAGFTAYHRLNKTRGMFRELSRVVTLLEWKLDPGLVVKKFPFFNKSFKSSSKNKEQELKERTTKAELFHPTVTHAKQSVEPPGLQTLPAWNKLPSAETRPGWLREFMTGLWFTSIASDDGQLTPEAWGLETVGSDSCCLSVSVPESLAGRFLAGSPGEVGGYLKRYLGRRLERTLGDVDMAAVWVRSGVATAPVTMFLFIRAFKNSIGDDLYVVEREGRFYRSLVRHRVPISPQGPLLVESGWMEYHAKLEDDRRRRGEGLAVDDLSDIDVDSYSHTTGFDIPESVAAVGSASHRRWRRYAEHLQLPSWMGASTLMLIKDVLVHEEDLVKERKHLADRRAKRKHASVKWKPADQARLDVLVKAHESLAGVRVYRGSPAQLSALIYGSGEVLGEYCQSEHKAGPARDLYQEIRASPA